MKFFIIEKRDDKIFRTNGRKLGIGDTIRIVGQRGFSGGVPLNILYKLHNGEMHLLIFYLGSFLIIGYKHWKEWKRLF